MASASVRPSATTRCFRTMNGTLVLRAAWATAANSSALRKPSAATSIRAPRFSTGFSRACRRGSDAGSMELGAVFDVTALGGDDFRGAVVALALGRFARAGDAAGAGAIGSAFSTEGAAVRRCRDDNVSLTDGPTATPTANTPTKAVVRAAALPAVIVHLPFYRRRGFCPAAEHTSARKLTSSTNPTARPQRRRLLGCSRSASLHEGAVGDLKHADDARRGRYTSNAFQLNRHRHQAAYAVRLHGLGWN